jgi:ribonucleoside-diphosphate reductase alpha chain
MIQICSIEHSNLQKVKLLLQTLGVYSKITFKRKAGKYMMPKNDGTGENKLYNCKDSHLMHVSHNGIQQLLKLGYNPKRLKISNKIHLITNQSRFIKIKSIEITDRFDKTYCFTEQKRNMGMFNGVLLGQCIEVHLPTNSERTAVCCLSSLNIELYDEWKDTNIVEDLITFLDNVLQYFIDNAPNELYKAKYSASMERSLGLGAMGFHAYLQKKMIPFTYKDAKDINNEIFSNIKLKAVNQSLKLGKERGEAPDMVGNGLRNAFLLAIAPNANSSMITGTTPSIEPMNANAFTHRSRVGSHLIKNKILEQLLEKYGKNTDEVWKHIILDKGSVENLDFLSHDEKQVFKTFKEIDPIDLVYLASDRQKYLCQGQSINLYFPPKCDKKTLGYVHFKAWETGCKGLYYLRTESSNKVDKLSEKVERNSLKDYKDNTDNECKACEG